MRSVDLRTEYNATRGVRESHRLATLMREVGNACAPAGTVPGDRLSARAPLASFNWTNAVCDKELPIKESDQSD